MSESTVSFYDSILVYGSPMVDKPAVMNDILRDNCTIGSSFVITTTGRDNLPIESDDSTTLYAGVAGKSESIHPNDLTRLGVQASEWLKQTGENPVVFIDNLRAFEMYCEPRRLYRFMHTLTRKVRSSGGTSIVFYDSPTEEAAPDCLDLFNTIIQIRESNSGVEWSVRTEEETLDWETIQEKVFT